MDEGLVHPCLELGDSPEHRLLTWAGRKAREKDGMIPLRPDQIAYQMRKVPGASETTFTHLEDGDWIEKEIHGESFRYRVLVFCSCRGENPLLAACGPASVGTMREALRTGTSVLGTSVFGSGALVGNTYGVKSKTAQKPVDQLARDFPRLVREAGIQMSPLQENYPALVVNLRRWHYDLGVSINEILQMMQEFVRHPDWCRRSRGAPWRVFLSRRDQLVGILANQKNRDPSLYWVS